VDLEKMKNALFNDYLTKWFMKTGKHYAQLLSNYSEWFEKTEKHYAQPLSNYSEWFEKTEKHYAQPLSNCSEWFEKTEKHYAQPLSNCSEWFERTEKHYVQPLSNYSEWFMKTEKRCAEQVSKISGMMKNGFFLCLCVPVVKIVLLRDCQLTKILTGYRGCCLKCYQILKPVVLNGTPKCPGVGHVSIGSRSTCIQNVQNDPAGAGYFIKERLNQPGEARNVRIAH